MLFVDLFNQVVPFLHGYQLFDHILELPDVFNIGKIAKSFDSLHDPNVKIFNRMLGEPGQGPVQNSTRPSS